MNVKDRLHGFVVEESRPLPELDAVMYRMRHEGTGLDLVWISRDEVNKTFGIAFETLPWDDTGVFHILEHSVLCGSDKYPVKEPFVELMKSSMNTFLNAMTFPDKTCYPISSRNDKDFMNLTRVYLDAVFRPLIYSKPEIFHQEGWHYEFDENGKPSYKGVVFNEMKGAMAGADELTYCAVNRALYPDSPYRWVSGGDPASIPDLTYENFVDAHKRFYSPSNGYVFLDGAVDIDAMLALLDGEYLQGRAKTERMAPPPMQKPVDAGTVEVEYELGEGEDPARRTRLAWGRVIGSFDQREKLVAMQILSQVLCGDNQAPLSKAILSQGLAESVSMHGAEDGIAQPCVILEVQNMAGSDRDKVNAVLTSELERLCREGLDRSRVEAVMANIEFKMRERDSGGMPQGLILGLQALETWLYGGHPADTLEVGDLFVRLKEKMEQGWFEQLIREVLLDNPHRCEVVLTPSKTAGEARRKQEADRLAAEEAAWSAGDKQALLDAQAKLTAWQGSEDTPETLATLPMLTLADVSPEPEIVPTQVTQASGVTLIRHDVNAAGIAYFSLYFDASDCTEEELSRLSFAAALLGKLSTQKHSSQELADLIRLLCGNLSFEVAPYGKAHDPKSYGVNLSVSFSVLEHNVSKAVELILEILTSTRWDEDAAALDILRQTKLDLFQQTVMAGHAVALGRVNAQLYASGAAAECAGGFTYYKWLAAQESAWDWAARKDTLAALPGRGVTKARLTSSATGGSDALAQQAAAQIAAALPAGSPAAPGKLAPWGLRREGIAIPADISFAILGGDLLANGGAYSGTAILASQIVSLAYLWNVIRVQGGAYGTGMLIRPTGMSVCYSFRDPSAVQSLQKYQGCADFLRQLCASGTDLTGFIIGAVAGTEPLLSPRLKGVTADISYW